MSIACSCGSTEQPRSHTATSPIKLSRDDRGTPGRLPFMIGFRESSTLCQVKLVHRIDWLFREAVKDLATRLVTSRSATYESQRLPYAGRAFPEPGEDPERAAIIREALRDWMNPEPPAEVTANLTRRIHTHLSQDNKRKNLVGEGFEDVIAAILAV